jgi:hypothetical protein
MQSNQRRDFGDNLEANRKFVDSPTMPKEPEQRLPKVPHYPDQNVKPTQP